MFEFVDMSSQGWYLTTLSSLLCVLGCFIIFLDDAYYFILPKFITSRFPFQIKENYAFMNGSLAFSSGCLLFTALYRLLPEAMSNISESYEEPSANANAILVVSFVGGIIICVMFNHVMHLITAESVVHCSHDGEANTGNDAGQHLHGGHAHSHHDHTDEQSLSSSSLLSSTHHHTHRHSQELSHDLLDSQEYNNNQHSGDAQGTYNNPEWRESATAKISNQEIDLNLLESQPLLTHKKSTGLVHFLTRGSTSEEPHLGECKGYSSAERCLFERNGELHYCEIPQLRNPEDEEDEDLLRACITEPDTDCKTHHSLENPHYHHDSDDHHHHHVNSPFSRLLLIGIQTILAITLHKLPEGFITYITSETNPQLGLSIFFSLLIHNYTEGFSMCLPLFYAFGDVKWRKLKALGISATLGGLSQPMGALFGYLFMGYYGEDNFDVNNLNYIFGISMSVTSGFLTVIALSMYGSSVSFSARPNFVSIWCLIGMSTIGVSTLFTSH